MNATLPAGHSKLLVCCRRNPLARLRLFCFPYSGAGPAVFRRWVAQLPPALEVWAIQLPGREARHAEPMNVPLYQLVCEAAVQIDAVGSEGPAAGAYAFYGHSLGAYLAYCTALKLSLSGPATALPRGLFLSGRRSPAFACDDPLASLPDDALVQRLARMGGISAELAAEPELLRMALPKLRYDLSLNETPLPDELKLADQKIAAPFWIYRGSADEQAPEHMVHSWCDFTAAKCAHVVLPGGHFFVLNSAANFMTKFSNDLKTLL
jgi:medium-chain acyl-[acyl-carrier-protein] hydrolase